MSKREISIDLIKILASFAVICLHIIDIPNSQLDKYVYYLSGCAIPLLFMVNGYLLLNKRQITFKKQSLKTCKMIGIVFLWCLLYSVMTYLNNRVWINPIQSTFDGLVQKGPLWQFWFIGALILLHLFLPILHKIFQKPKLAVLVTLSFILICFSLDLSNVLFVALDKPLIQSYVPQTFRLWNHFAYFFLGGLLGKPEIKQIIKEEVKGYKHFIILVVLSWIIVYYQIYMGQYYYGTTYAEYFYDNIFIMSWNIVLFTWLTRFHLQNSKIINTVEYISVNTFGVYAMHLYLLNLIPLVFNYQITTFYLWIPISIFLVGQVISSILRCNRYTKHLVTF